ncbi:retrotransposon protein, putative, ty1-copia subclass [Tanacetum coccineum]
MLRADLILRFFVNSIGVTVNHGMSLQTSETVSELLTCKQEIPPPLKKENPAKDRIATSWLKLGTRGGTVRLPHLGFLPGSKNENQVLKFVRGNGKLLQGFEVLGKFLISFRVPTGLVIFLKKSQYAPSITRGVISVSRLYDDSFINRFDENNVLSVSKNNLFYFVVVPRDGLLNSTDIQSLGKCISCMSGKMARKPYSHQVERAKDLLGLIHTDVCGPFKIVSRQCASYFVTFTDDFSRYGYVYLLKHKHEVFDTFKVFQKEVENQLGKTIKSLRSDRGGEYMSQEFLDHLKKHGIIAHRIPPYHAHNNGVSERRKSNTSTQLDHERMIKKLMNYKVILIPFVSPLGQRAPDRMDFYRMLEEHKFYKVSHRYSGTMTMDMANGVRPLKQASMQWNKRFDDEIKKFGIHSNRNEHGVYLKVMLHIFLESRSNRKVKRNTKDMFLVYGGNMEQELRVSCYTDVGYLTDAGTLRSQTGYVLF